MWYPVFVNNNIIMYFQEWCTPSSSTAGRLHPTLPPCRSTSSSSPWLSSSACSRRPTDRIPTTAVFRAPRPRPTGPAPAPYTQESTSPSPRTGPTPTPSPPPTGHRQVATRGRRCRWLQATMGAPRFSLEGTCRSQGQSTVGGAEGRLIIKMLLKLWTVPSDPIKIHPLLLRLLLLLLLLVLHLLLHLLNKRICPHNSIKVKFQILLCLLLLLLGLIPRLLVLLGPITADLGQGQLKVGLEHLQVPLVCLREALGILPASLGHLKVDLEQFRVCLLVMLEHLLVVLEHLLVVLEHLLVVLEHLLVVLEQMLTKLASAPNPTELILVQTTSSPQLVDYILWWPQLTLLAQV